VEEPNNREELVKKYGRMLTPTIVIDEEMFLGFGINKENVVRKLKI